MNNTWPAIGRVISYALKNRGEDQRREKARKITYVDQNKRYEQRLIFRASRNEKKFQFYIWGQIIYYVMIEFKGQKINLLSFRKPYS